SANAFFCCTRSRYSFGIDAMCRSSHAVRATSLPQPAPQAQIWPPRLTDPNPRSMSLRRGEPRTGTQPLLQSRCMMPKTLSDSERSLIHKYWSAANYLSVGQIYLYDNPLLKQQLSKDHIKPRLLGHWGTTPGLNFIYVHLNRLIRQLDLNMIYVTGPGHGGPALVANAYLEGTYSEVYPNIACDEEGMKRLFTQFSFPGGVPSHVAPETPGSIHE